MNARLSLLSLSLLSAAPLRAGEPIDLAPSVQSPWRFGIGYAPLLGVKTEFNGLGRFNSPFTPQPTGGGVDYDYDNGFVHVDSSQNAGGKTWNWSYDQSSQYNAANGGSIDYSLTNSLSNGRASERDNAAAGIELFTLLDMGAAELGGLAPKGSRWGFRGGFHYAHIDIDNTDVLSTNLTVLTDSFNLDGTIPPQAPYVGSFNGPGPLIGDSPTRTISSGGTALVTGTRELDVHLATLSLGSYLEIPIAPKLDLLLEAGVSAALADGTYKFRSITSVPGLGTQTSTGRDSSSSVLLGFYLGLGATYQVNKDWAILLSGRYQYLEDFQLGANGSNADLSFDSAFILSTGITHSF